MDIGCPQLMRILAYVPRNDQGGGSGILCQVATRDAREVEELRNTSIEVRWQQFNTLLAWARDFGWTGELAKDEDLVRKRWARLRKESRG